jgi:ribosomal protein L44E
MPQHYTRATTEVSVYCNRCRKETMHRVDDRKRGPCLECLARLESLSEARKQKPAAEAKPKQGGLFE